MNSGAHSHGDGVSSSLRMPSRLPKSWHFFVHSGRNLEVLTVRTNVALFFLSIVVFGLPAFAADDWVEDTSLTHPSARNSAGMAYAGRGNVVLFGGYEFTTPSYLGETWTYDVTTGVWTFQNLMTEPSNRMHPCMAHIGRDQVLLFSGYGGTVPLTDTWLYDLGDNTWTQLSPISSPESKNSADLAFIGDDNVMLFGGYYGGYQDETWIFDLSDNTWTQKVPSTSPSARQRHRMEYIGGDKVILFGGYDGSILGDTWVYDLSDNTWTEMNPGTAPSARERHGMAYLGDDQILLFGGWLGTNQSDQSWIYDLSDNLWIQDSNSTQPIARYGMVMAASSMSMFRDAVLFGGYRNGTGDLDDTWLFGGGDFVPIELAAFVADAEEGKVTLWWATESEDDNLGFNIYRSKAPTGVYDRLTTELIAGSGTISSRSEYHFVDENVANGMTYWYKLEDVKFDGTATMHGPISATPGDGMTVPEAEILSLAFPNPVSADMTIQYRIHEPAAVRLGIYNMNGQELRVLVSEHQLPGEFSIIWNGMDDNNRKVSSGVYFYRFQVGESAKQIGRAILLR